MKDRALQPAFDHRLNRAALLRVPARPVIVAAPPAPGLLRSCSATCSVPAMPVVDSSYVADKYQIYFKEMAGNGAENNLPLLLQASRRIPRFQATYPISTHLA
jgi:hypothetical protein